MVKTSQLFWFSIAWIALTLLKGAGTIDDGFKILFRIGKDHIHGDTPYYSKYEVWEMSTGLWTILGLVIWGSILIREIFKMIQARRNPLDVNGNSDGGCE